ncbi:MAG TPA: hemin uptake protein HemP [Methylomirabilota bacterium]
MSEEAPAAPIAEPATGGILIRIASTDVFRGQREVVIIHRGQEYRLHITKADKLILTK